MSYSKQCNKCEKTIYMIQTNGKWCASEDSIGNTAHKCSASNGSSSDSRITRLEEHIHTLYMIIDSLTDRVLQLKEKS